MRYEMIVKTVFGVGFSTYVLTSALPNLANYDLAFAYDPPSTGTSTDSRDTNPGGSPQPVCLVDQAICIPAVDIPLTALVYIPPQGRGDTLQLSRASEVIGFTFLHNPTLFFYVPYESKSYDTLMFSLIGTQGERVIPRQAIDLSGTPGIIAITLPQETYLEENTDYRWTLSIQFVTGGDSSDIVVSGRLRRIAPSQLAASQLQEITNPVERATILENESIWYDMIAEAANTREINNLLWSRLLTEAGLQEIAGEALVSSHTLQSQLPTSR